MSCQLTQLSIQTCSDYLRIYVKWHPVVSGLIGHAGMMWAHTDTPLGLVGDIAWRSGPANLYAILHTPITHRVLKERISSYEWSIDKSLIRLL